MSLRRACGGFFDLAKADGDIARGDTVWVHHGDGTKSPGYARSGKGADGKHEVSYHPEGKRWSNARVHVDNLSHR